MKHKLLLSLAAAVLLGACSSTPDSNEAAAESQLANLRALFKNGQSIGLVLLTSEYHKQTGEWPSGMEDLKEIKAPGVSSKDLKEMRESLDLEAVQFFPQSSKTVLTAYTKKNKITGRFILAAPIAGPAVYQFCSVPPGAMECSNFTNLEFSINQNAAARADSGLKQMVDRNRPVIEEYFRTGKWPENT